MPGRCTWTFVRLTTVVMMMIVVVRVGVLMRDVVTDIGDTSMRMTASMAMAQMLKLVKATGQRSRKAIDGGDEAVEPPFAIHGLANLSLKHRVSFGLRKHTRNGWQII